MSNINISYESSYDDDGRLSVKPAIAVSGASMYYSGPTFTAAKLNSIVWDKIVPVPPFAKTPRGWATIKIYDAAGAEITLEANEGDAVTTVVDITPDLDIELTGGAFAIPNSLSTGDWHVYAFAAPEIPFAAGGQVPFVEDQKIDGFYEGEDIIIDGRVTKHLKYDDASNVPFVQYQGGLHTAFDPVNDFATHLANNYTVGNEYIAGDIIVLAHGPNPDVYLWESYVHNGGTSVDETDFTSVTVDLGSGNVNIAPTQLGWYGNTIRFIISHPANVDVDDIEFQITLDSYIKWI